MKELTATELATGIAIRMTNPDGSVAAIDWKEFYDHEPREPPKHRAPEAIDTWAEGLIDE